MIEKILNTHQYETRLGQTKPIIKIGGKDKNTRKKFVPNLNFSFRKLGKERFFINVNHSDIIVKKQVPSFDGGIGIDVDNVATRYYEIGEGLEHEVKLNVKPKTNKVVFDLKYSSDILWQEVKSSTKDSNVENSYFAYHVEKKNNGRLTEVVESQLMQIPRSFVFDKNGVKHWCKQSIKNNKWIITIPKKVYSNKSLYPLTVGPTYLFIDEQSTYYDIYCDGYVVRIHTDGSDEYIGEVLDPDNLSTAWARFGSKISVLSTIYALSEDTGISVSLIEINSIRAVFRIVGDFESSSQVSLTNESGSEIYLYIYTDKIVQHLIFNATGSITLDDSANNGFCFMDLVAANVASEDAVYENGGSESTVTSDGEQNSADYIGLTSTEIDIIGIKRFSSLGGGTSSYGQYIDDPADGALRFRWNNGTITSLSEMVVMWILDSADRDGGKDYNSTDRITFGNQYTANEILNITGGGQDVLDLNIPKTINSSYPFASDGAEHFELDSVNDNLEVTAQLGAIKPAVVIEDHPIQTGSPSSPTSYLLEYFKMNDNAASTTILAAVGNNAKWKDESNNEDNTADFDVSDRIKGSTSLDSQSTNFVELATGNYTNAVFKKKSVIINCKPQFDYNISLDQVLWHEYIDANNSIELRYDAGNDKFELDVKFGGTIVNCASVAYGSGELDRWLVIHAFWDYDNDICGLTIDGSTQEVDYSGWTSVSSSGSTYVSLGAQRTGVTTITSGDYYLDWFKVFNDIILPYGGCPWVGNNVVNTSLAHSDVLFYWDGSDCTSENVDIGGVQGFLDSNNTGGTTSFPITGGIGNGPYFDNESINANYSIGFNVTNEDIIKLSTQGSLFIVFSINTIGNGDNILGVGDAANNLQVEMDTSGNIDVIYRANSLSEKVVGNIAFAVGEWIYLRVSWQQGGQLKSWINGKQNGTPQDIANAWAGSTTSEIIYFGNDYAAVGQTGNINIYRVVITDDPNTPDNWSKMGVPLHLPEVKKESILKQMGSNYQMAFLPNGNLIYTDIESMLNTDVLELAFTWGTAPITFVSSMVGDSLTSDLSLNILRRIVSSMVGDSLTSDITLEIASVVLFVSSMVGNSETTQITLEVLRRYVSSIAGESFSTDIQLEVLRRFDGNIGGDTETSEANLNVLRRVVSDMYGDSETSQTTLEVLRRILSSVVGDSLTSDIELLTTTLIAFVSSMKGDSETASINLNVLRRVVSNMYGDSETSDSNLTILYRIVSSMFGDSETSNPTLLLGDLKTFVSAMSGDTEISDARLAVIRLIDSTMNGESISTDAALEVIRKITSSMTAESLTSSARLLVIALGIIIDSGISEVSETLAIVDVSDEVGITEL